jgi:hypothetical protein
VFPKMLPFFDEQAYGAVHLATTNFVQIVSHAQKQCYALSLL